MTVPQAEYEGHRETERKGFVPIMALQSMIVVIPMTILAE